MPDGTGDPSIPDYVQAVDHDNPNDDGIYLDVNKVDQFATSYRENFWKLTADRINKAKWSEYGENPEKHQRYVLKPLTVVLPFGTVGMLLLVGQMFVPHFSDYSGLIRLGMLFAGALCVFQAWPYFRNVQETDAEREAMADAHAQFDEARKHIGH